MGTSKVTNMDKTAIFMINKQTSHTDNDTTLRKYISMCYIIYFFNVFIVSSYTCPILDLEY